MRLVGLVGGLPAVRTLLEVLAAYDRAGGGLTAGGLAYSALIALIPGMLLVAAALGWFVSDPQVQARIVDAIGAAVPPLEQVARTALETVSAGAVPTSIVALLGLLWGSSRFYAALDYAFSKVFQAERRRNEIERTLRGVLVTILFVALPIAALVAGSIATWLLDVAPDGRIVEGATGVIVALASPIGSFLLFVAVVSLVYRFVPPERPPLGSLGPPAVIVGVILAAFTQLFTFIAPRLVGWAALYGAFVTVFALLAWLSIGFNVLLLGASWTSVRIDSRRARAAAAAADGGADAGAETPRIGPDGVASG